MSNKPKYSTKSSPKGKFNIETGEFDPPVRFFNIPFEWAQYLTGYEFEAVNRDGTPKLTKGRKPVEKKIDYLDLMILDYIRSFAARRNRYCFAESAAVADAVGMVGQEREICERVLQLAAIGFIQVKQVIHPYKRSVLRLLEVNEKKIKECILSRKESILNEVLELQNPLTLPEISTPLRLTYKNIYKKNYKRKYKKHYKRDYQRNYQMRPVMTFLE